jgi:hypothetical protein
MKMLPNKKTDGLIIFFREIMNCAAIYLTPVSHIQENLINLKRFFGFTYARNKELLLLDKNIIRNLYKDRPYLNIKFKNIFIHKFKYIYLQPRAKLEGVY